MEKFSIMYDRVMYPFEKRHMQKIRKDILKYARGEILEVGIGTGANFSFYPEGVTVVGIEPNENMLKVAEKKENKPSFVRLIHGQAESLPFPDETFDTVLSTLVLCSVKDLKKSLSEMNRVLKKDGVIILYEHIRVENPGWIGYVQDKLTLPWEHFSNGCRLNRNTIDEAKKYFSFNRIKEYSKGIFITAIGEKI